MATVQTSKSGSDKKKTNQSGAAASQSRGRKAAAETGERDENYNLISVLYHALQAADTYAQYMRDAEETEDGQLAQFLEEARSSQVMLAQQAKQLLATRLDDEELEGEDDELEAEEE